MSSIRFPKAKSLFLLWIVLGISFQVQAKSDWIKDLPAFDPKPDGSHRWVRVAIHMHSVYSHDACDKKPQKNGQINSSCLNHLRSAVCQNHIDVLFLTEHRDLMAFNEFNKVLALQPEDQPIFENGQIVGAYQKCPDGHRVLVLPGAENELMPLALKKHPRAIDGNLEATYNSSTPEAGLRFREAGALLAIPHTEKKTLEAMQALKPDLMEVYNTHANFQFVQKMKKSKMAKIVLRLLRFMTSPFLEADLGFLAFFQENKSALDKWAALSLTQKVTAIAGADAHENVLKLKLKDHERLDSYRRTTRWFSNFAFIQGPLDRENILEAMKRGNTFVGFEVFGSVQPFEFSGFGSSGNPYHMGDTVNPSIESQIHLRVRIGNMTSDKVRLQILKAELQGWKIVAETSLHSLDFVTSDRGVYRAQINIIPNSLKKFVPTMKSVVKEFPWIYTNPIYYR